MSRTIMVVGAHADDIEINTGGMLEWSRWRGMCIRRPPPNLRRRSLGSCTTWP